MIALCYYLLAIPFLPPEIAYKNLILSEAKTRKTPYVVDWYLQINMFFILLYRPVWNFRKTSTCTRHFNYHPKSTIIDI